MRVWVALLRAVNVGGHGKIAMEELRSIFESAGCLHVRTYIASGNVVFRAGGTEGEIRDRLERAIEAGMGGHVDVMLRSSGDLEAAFQACPFRAHPGNRVVIVFLPGPVAEGGLTDVRGRNGEEIDCAAREVFIHYPMGMGRSRLRVPAIESGTARNLNTVSKLIEMARETGA